MFCNIKQESCFPLLIAERNDGDVKLLVTSCYVICLDINPILAFHFFLDYKRISASQIEVQGRFGFMA